MYSNITTFGNVSKIIGRISFSKPNEKDIAVLSIDTVSGHTFDLHFESTLDLETFCKNHNVNLEDSRK